MGPNGMRFQEGKFCIFNFWRIAEGNYAETNMYENSVPACGIYEKWLAHELANYNDAFKSFGHLLRIVYGLFLPSRPDSV